MTTPVSKKKLAGVSPRVAGRRGASEMCGESSTVLTTAVLLVWLGESVVDDLKNEPH